MTDNEIYQKYTFSYNNSGMDMNLVLSETDDNILPWPMLLSKFIRFLEMTHNYEIMHKVQLKYSPFIDPETDWQGKFFDVPESEKEEHDTEEDEKAGLTE
jgi:hypothetical protein